MQDLPSGKILGLFTGEPEQLWAGKPPSAIRKRRQAGRLEVTTDGFVDDAQADLTVHGGPEKAIHHYAAEHMAHWKTQFPDHADFFQAGCFGENISTLGLTEDVLCLGDILTLGSVRVQICQGRQPCWKLSAHSGIEAMAAQFQLTGKTGWYYRVLQAGHVSQDDRINVIARPHPDISLAALTQARFNPRLNRATAERYSRLAVLSDSWRQAFEHKAQKAPVQTPD